MKALTLTLMLAALLGFAVLTLNAVSVTVAQPEGLMNPIVHFALAPGTRDEFLSGLLGSAISVYLYTVVTWIDRQLCALRHDGSSATTAVELAQPLAVRQLKDAIRAGDIDAVHRWATRATLAFSDDRFMSPLELAELYGRDEIVRALRAAAARNPAPRISISAQAGARSVR